MFWDVKIVQFSNVPYVKYITASYECDKIILTTNVWKSSISFGQNIILLKWCKWNIYILPWKNSPSSWWSQFRVLDAFHLQCLSIKSCVLQKDTRQFFHDELSHLLTYIILHIISSDSALNIMNTAYCFHSWNNICLV